MYRQQPQPRRPYPAYGGYQQYVPRGPPRGAYGQPYIPRGAYGQAYQPPVAVHPRHPYLDQLGIQSKFFFGIVDRELLQICQRHPRRVVGGDLLHMKCLYADKTKEDLSIPLDAHIAFNLKNEGTCLVPEPVPTKAVDKDGSKTRYFVKVMLLSGAGPEDEKLKGKVHLAKRLNFLLVKKEHGPISAIGGEWSAEKDGAAPNDANLKKAAIRLVKDTVGVDISACNSWLKFVEFHYTREEGKSVTVYFLPNIWDHYADGIEPLTQVREEKKEVKEEVEEEEDDPEDPEKKKKVKKQVTVEKTIKVVEWKPVEMSLHSLLDYDCSRPLNDDIPEVCLFADCFNEMLQRDFGLEVLAILRKKKEENEAQEAEKKRKREEDEEAAAAKKAKAENGEVAKEEEKEAKKDEPAAAKPKMKLQHNVNQEILQPFQYFDRVPHTGMISSSLRRDILEGTLHQYGNMTKHEVDDLLLKGAGLRPTTGAYNSPPSILYYVKMATTTVEVPVEEVAEETKQDKMEEDKVEAAAEESAEKEEASAEDAEAGASAEDGAMTEAGLNKLLLKDLRTMCQEKGLSTAGKKADLIERLLKGE